MTSFFTKNKKAFYGGIVATLFTGLGVFVIGQISDYEAKQLIATSHEGMITLCNTIILASATILTLLLTLLGISSGSESKLKNDHYLQVLDIAKLDTVLLVATLVILQLFNIPIIQADKVTEDWYSTIYWMSLLFSSILNGAMITVVLMLYTTINNIIQIVGLGHDHYMISDEIEEDKHEAE